MASSALSLIENIVGPIQQQPKAIDIMLAAGQQGPVQASPQVNYNGPGPWAAPNPTPVQTGPTAAEIQAAKEASIARNQVAIGMGNVNSTASNTAGNWLTGFNNDVTNFLENAKTGQTNLDNKRVDAKLNYNRGYNDILDMVGRGIQSGGVQLASRNASDSSAAGAIARAYGQIGQRNQNNLQGQYDSQNRGFDNEQNLLNTQIGQGLRGFRTERDQTINSIISQAESDLNALNEIYAGAGLADRIAIEKEKQRIKASVTQQLASVESQLGKTSSVKPMDSTGIARQANEWAQQGRATENPFNYDTTAPMYSNSVTSADGAPISLLPIYSNRRRT